MDLVLFMVGQLIEKWICRPGIGQINRQVFDARGMA
jgi:hypothetical protein